MNLHDIVHAKFNNVECIDIDAYNTIIVAFTHDDDSTFELCMTHDEFNMLHASIITCKKQMNVA